MKITLATIIAITGGMNILSQVKLPAKTSYRVAKAINKMKPELAAFEEQRTNLAKEFGTLSEDGQNYTFSEENGKLFSDQLNALLLEEVELNIPTIAPADLEGVSIEPAVLMQLDGIFIVDES